MQMLRGLLSIAALAAAGALAGERREAALEGPAASIEYAGAGEVDALKPGAVLFTDRTYTLKEQPAWLAGQAFLRYSIDSGCRLRVTADGVLTVLTPEPAHPRAATQAKALEGRGFAWVASPERFQLFGAQPFDLTRVYQKQVKKGERLRFGKWAVIVGFAHATSVPAAGRPWSENTGERLYNGIVLPAEWPPQEIEPRDTAPMPVPYLDCPPKVVPIDVGRQLFVDDFLVATSTLKRVFHLPRKYEGNPILKPETALELNGDKNDAAVPKSGGVWWDPAERLFKMWYEAGWIHTICTATSRDGLTWERPKLDVVPGTNQVLPPDLTPDSWTVVPDWEAADPQQRYKMYMRPPGGQMPGLSMTSPDGIHWTNRVASGDTGDRSTMFYNPFRKKWVYSLRSSFRGRSRHYWECDDFLAGAKWPADGPVVWAAADRDDPKDWVTQRTPQLYNLDAVAYESLMLGFYQIHHGPENDVCEKAGVPKITELTFAYSRDGFHWHRPDRRIAIASERRDVWDRGYVQSIGNLCCVRGDTLWFYYTGFQGDTAKTNANWLKNGMYDRGATGVAFLRRDGFASLEAGAEGGELTTRPVTFGGSRVFVNAAAAGGEVRAEILDEAGRPIAPFTLANCRPVAADSTLAEVAWDGAADVSALCGRAVRFRFAVRQAALYAFWVSRDASGRSDGYVAGGGPGFTGPTDTVGRAALAAETYANPVVPEIGPADPHVILHNGVYYLYCTGDNVSYHVYTSRDLVHWTKGHRVFQPGGKGVWAPDVYANPGDGRFYLYYTAAETVGVAVAEGPEGPFCSAATLCERAIDAHLFRDDDGRLYLYYVQLPGSRIMVQRMRSPVEKDGAPAVELLRATEPWETVSGHVTEGPFMLKRGGLYYLLYSGTGADSPNYGVGYATATSPAGPFAKHPGNPIVARGAGVYGPGHGCVVRDARGALWHVYHQQRDEARGWKRFLCLDPLWFDGAGVLHGQATRGAPQPAPAAAQAAGDLLPPGWDARAAADRVLAGLVTVTAPQVKGAHDAEMALVGDRAYVVAEVNDVRPGEAAAWPEVYCALSVVDLKTMAVERVIPFARGEQSFENETLPVGACFVPRILQKDEHTLRCFFASEQPGKRQAQTWFIDFDLASQTFGKTIRRAKLKTAAGVFDMQPQALYADAAAQGFARPAVDFGLYLFDSFKTFDGRIYVALNNYPGGQNALALVNEAKDTFEVLGHYNGPASLKLTESAANRLPDGTWLAVCRQEGGSRNYVFCASKDGRAWTPGECRNAIPNGTSSKPTFDRIGGLYWLGWQEAATGAVGRAIFNVEVSRDGASWARKYRFATDKSFQYPTFREHGGRVYVCVTQGDAAPDRKERIMLGRVE